MKVFLDFMRPIERERHAFFINRNLLIRRRRLDDVPLIILIVMRIKRDLLLSRSTRVIVRVRMQVPAVRVDVSKSDGGTERDVCVGIAHSVSAECVLELGGHEPVAFAGLLESTQVHGKGD